MKGITRRVMLLAAFVAVAGIAACKHKGEGGPPSDTGASYDEDADTGPSDRGMGGGGSGAGGGTGGGSM